MKHISTLLRFVFLFCSIQTGFAQNAATTNEVAAFPLDTLVEATQITEQALENAHKIISDTATYLAPLQAFEKLLGSNAYILSNDSIYADYTDVMLAGFEDVGVFWAEYEAALLDLHKQTSDKINAIGQLAPELALLRQRWLATQKPSNSSLKTSEAILETIHVYDTRIAAANTKLNAYLDVFLRLDARIAKHIKQVALARIHYDDVVKDKAKSVFMRDSKPLFGALAAADAKTTDVLRSGWLNDKVELNAFFIEKRVGLILHLFFTLLIMLLIRSIVSKTKAQVTALDTDVDKTLATNPLMGGLIIGLFATRLFYSDTPNIYLNVLIMVGLVPASFMLPKILSNKMRMLPYFLLAVVLLSMIIGILHEDVVYERLAHFVSAILTLLGLLFFVLRTNNRKAIKAASGELLVIIIYGLIILLIVSIVANLVGFSQLAMLFSVGVLYSLTTGLIAFVAVKMGQAVLRLIAFTPTLQKLNIIRLNIAFIETWIVYLTTIVGIIFWTRSVFASFRILRSMQDLYMQVISKTWQFGEASLSLQNIIDFVLIVFIFYLISNAIHRLLQDEVLPRFDLRSGFLLGFAILSRYIILFLGFVLAMSAAGISLSKLNLIIGALGVGIGFGLQNIVSNFVSGFVIIFERPLHIGDTITAGTLEGEVTAIGLRSSRIRTYEGAEVIVPNNMLVDNEVTNWTYTDRKRRVERFVYIESGTNPRHVKMIIDGVLSGHPGLMDNDDSKAFFLVYEDNALKFRVLMWMVSGFITTPSEVLMNMHEALTANGYKPYIPVQKVILSQETKAVGNVIGGEVKPETNEDEQSN